MHSLCRLLAKLCRDHSGDEQAAKAIRTLVASIPLWPRAVLPLQQMVERSQQLSDLINEGQVISLWLFDLGLATADPALEERVHQLELQFHTLLEEMEERRAAHEVLLVQVREGDFVESGSVRSTLSGLSTASK